MAPPALVVNLVGRRPSLCDVGRITQSEAISAVQWILLVGRIMMSFVRRRSTQDAAMATN
jgi:hypothetical protein